MGTKHIIKGEVGTVNKVLHVHSKWCIILKSVLNFS